MPEQTEDRERLQAKTTIEVQLAPADGGDVQTLRVTVENDAEWAAGAVVRQQIEDTFRNTRDFAGVARARHVRVWEYVENAPQ